MIARLLILGVLVYTGARAFLWARRFIKSLPFSREVGMPRDSAGVNDMVRDPVCGLYVTSHESITAVVRGRVFHFCSAECRRKFIENQG